MRAVLERDFLFEASRTRAVVLRTVVAALVAAAVVVAVLAGSDEFRNKPDEVGAWLFRAGAGALLGMVALLAPPVVVGSVLAERQQETLPLVLATPVGPRRFALAKLVSRTGVVVLLASAALPSLALTTLFGGISGRQVTDLGFLVLGTAVELAAWSLWFSTASRRLATAVVLSFLVPAARWALLTVLFAWTLDDARGTSFLEQWLVPLTGAECTTPIPGLAEVMLPGSLGRGWGWRGATPAPGSAADLLLRYPAQAYFLFALASAAAAVFAAGKRLRSESEPKESWLARTRLGRRWFRKGTPGRNPVTWKEVRLLNTSSSRPLFYAVLGVLLLSEALFAKTARDDEETIGLVVFQITVLCLLCAANGASILGQERTQGSYDLLRASPLTPGQILRGKAAGIFAGLLLLATVPMGHALASVKSEGIQPPTFFAVAFLSLALPWGWAALGMATATHAPRARTAVLRTLSAFAVCLVGLPLAGFAVLLVISWRKPYSDLSEFLAFGCPPAGLFAFLEGFDDRFFRVFTPPAFAWQPRQEQVFGLYWTLVYLVLAAVLTLTLRRRFVRALERDREG